MTDLWMPGAQRLASSHEGQPMLGGPARAVWHRTVGQGFAGNAGFLKQEGFEPHILWDPTTGETGQFIAADRSGYALEHPSGTTQTNREGSVCIQIEVADHGKTWDITAPLDSNGKPTGMLGWPKIRAWLFGLGIPEVWPGGAPPKLGTRAEVTSEMWLTKAGHYSHSQVPNNHHTDPGHMDLTVLFAPATRLLYRGMSGPDVQKVKHGLNVLGNHLDETSNVFDAHMADVVRVFQAHRGLPVTAVFGAAELTALRKDIAAIAARKAA